MARTSRSRTIVGGATATALAVVFTACGSTSTSNTSTGSTRSTKTSASANPSVTWPGRTATAAPRQLKLKVVPAAARAGSSVAITVTGCSDASGSNHDLTYSDTSMAPRHIRAKVAGTTLTARFKVPRVGLSHGTLTARCGGAQVTGPFRVSGRTTTIGVVVRRTRVADGYLVVLAPTEPPTSDDAIHVIPDHPTLTYLIPTSWVRPASMLIGQIEVSADGRRVTAVAIL